MVGWKDTEAVVLFEMHRCIVYALNYRSVTV